MACINLYTATLEELETLDGIGENRARQIIRQREKMPINTTRLVLWTGIPEGAWKGWIQEKKISLAVNSELLNKYIHQKNEEIKSLKDQADALGNDLAVEKDLHGITQQRLGIVEEENEELHESMNKSANSSRSVPGLIPMDKIPGLSGGLKGGRKGSRDSRNRDKRRSHRHGRSRQRKYAYDSSSEFSTSGSSSSEDSDSNLSSDNSTHGESRKDVFSSESARKFRIHHRSKSPNEGDNFQGGDRRTFRRRSRTPPAPKMEIFSGDGRTDWETFIIKFVRLADDRRWSKRKLLSKFYDSLTGVAAKYALKLRTNSWSKLVKEMERRFSTKEDPAAARRQLVYMRQNENESLEEFGQRIYFMAMDGYDDEKSTTIEKIAVEHFLRGIKDKHAAERAFDKAPTTIAKAMKYVKKAVSTHKAIYGSAKPNYQIRYSTVDEEEHRECRLALSQNNSGQFRPKSPVVNSITLKSVGTWMTPPSSPRSSSPRFNTRSNYRSPARDQGLCFKCGVKGHFAKDCPENQNRHGSASPVQKHLNA